MDRLTEITDPASNDTTFSYSDNGWLVERTDASGSTVEYDHDEVGRLVRFTDALDYQYDYAYDGNGCLTSITDPASNSTTFVYDDADRLVEIEDATGNSILITRDKVGNITEVENREGNSTYYTYDDVYRLTKFKDALNNETDFQYNDVGQITKRIDPLNNETKFAYDAAHRLKKVVNRLGKEWEFTRDAGGHVTEIEDARGNTAWKYTYDSKGRVVEAEDALAKKWSYSYDAAWNLASKTDAKSQTVSFTYDNRNRVTNINAPGTSDDVTIGYDPTGHVTSMTNSTIAFAYDYDANYRLVEKEDTTNSLAVEYEYNSRNLRTKMTDPSNQETTYSYNELNRLVEMNDAQSETYEFEYDKDGRRTKLTYGNDSYTDYYYDAAGRMWAIDNLKSNGTTVSSIEYTFDACGRVTDKEEYGVGETEYDYDAEGQLTEVSYPAGNTDTFSYDDNGNRTQWGRSSDATISYIYNNADQLTQSTEGTIGTSYSHDNNGNLTGETTGGVTKTFNYDPFDRMTSVVQGQTTLQSMTYGPDSKRLSLTDSSGTRKFFYDGNDVIQEYNSNWSSVTKEYTHGPWVDEPLSMTDHTSKEANNTYYLMKDRLGSIINILDENETLKTTYRYDAFGEPTATYHSGQVDCMYRFTGRVFDGAMGAYFYRARYYNQSLGRFFSRDPIMSLGSLYAYCNNSPENFTDPSGRLDQPVGSDRSNLSSSSGGFDEGTPFAVPGPWWWWMPLPWSGLGMRWLQQARNALGLSDTSGVTVESQKQRAKDCPHWIGDVYGEGIRIGEAAFGSVCPFDMAAMLTASFDVYSPMSDMLGMWGIEMDPFTGEILSFGDINLMIDLTTDLILNPSEVLYPNIDRGLLQGGL